MCPIPAFAVGNSSNTPYFFEKLSQRLSFNKTKVLLWGHMQKKFGCRGGLLLPQQLPILISPHQKYGIALLGCPVPTIKIGMGMFSMVQSMTSNPLILVLINHKNIRKNNKNIEKFIRNAGITFSFFQGVGNSVILLKQGPWGPQVTQHQNFTDFRNIWVCTFWQ